MKKESILFFLQEKFQYYVYLLVAFLMPLTKTYLPYLMFLWVLSILLSVRQIKLRLFKGWWLIWLLLIFYFGHIIGLIYSNDLKNGLFDLEVKLSILFIPFAILFISEKIQINYITIFKVFVIGNFIASIICIFYAFRNSIQLDELGSYIFEPSVWPEGTKNLSFFQLMNKGYSHFSYTYLSRIHHPSYFSVFITFSIVILVYLSRMTKGKVLFYYFLIGYFIIFLWMLGSRAAYLTFLFVLISFCIILILKFDKYKIGIGILLLGSIISVIVVSNSRLNKNILESVSIIKNAKNLNQDSDVRLWLWKCGLEVFKENWLVGTGTGDINNELNNKYDKYNLEEAHRHMLNAHNQYIDVAVKLGILGLIVILTFIIGVIELSIRYNHILLFNFALIIGINLFFEAMLNTLAGVSFFAFFYSLLISKNN